MKYSKERVGGIIVLLLLLAFVYFFTNIVIYLLVAAIISFIGRPVMSLLGKIEIKGKTIPASLRALVTLSLIIFSVVLFVWLLFPAVASQASNLQDLDTQAIANSLEEPIANIDSSLKDYGIIEENESMSLIVSEKLTQLVSTIDFSKILNNIISLTGTVFIGAFAIIFFLFFFLKDNGLFHTIVMAFIPADKKESTEGVIKKVKKLLTRYSVGLLAEVLSMMTLISLGGFLFGIENAILIGFLGGLMNIIPYVGPIIGATIGSSLVLLSNLDASFVDVTSILILKILSVFLIANLFDNIFLQPLIYSKSVKAHPMEIFIIIIVGGTVAGPIGMILAIPFYTVIRIVAKEFLSEMEIVRKITKNI